MEGNSTAQMSISPMVIMKVLLLSCVIAILSSCGKYSPPVSPEKLAPQPVGSLTATADLRGIRFTWSAPEQDQRGKELKYIDGYRVYRKPIIETSDIVDPEVRYVELAFIEDTHLEKLKELREAAKVEGKISRRVTVDDTLKNFEYTDLTVEAGKSYLYRIVPVNQGGVEGAPGADVKVTFRGITSEFQYLALQPAADDLNF